MIEQMAKERNIPDLKGSESLEFLKIDYVNYNFTKWVKEKDIVGSEINL